jgi:hypothetical protein
LLAILAVGGCSERQFEKSRDRYEFAQAAGCELGKEDGRTAGGEAGEQCDENQPDSIAPAYPDSFLEECYSAKSEGVLPCVNGWSIGHRECFEAAYLDAYQKAWDEAECDTLLDSGGE